MPPISMMAIVGYTHTQAPLPPPTDPYKSNNNIVLSPFSAFWGGAITSNIGAFAQVTYNAVPRRRVRRSVRAHLDVGQYRCPLCADREHRAHDLIYGITANNNPTVQDRLEYDAGMVLPLCRIDILGAAGARHHDRGRACRACRRRRRLHLHQ